MPGNTRNDIESELAVLKNEVAHLKELALQGALEQRSTNNAIYGFEEKSGIYLRISALESKVGIIWKAIAVFGAAVITIVLNIFFGLPKK